MSVEAFSEKPTELEVMSFARNEYSRWLREAKAAIAAGDAIAATVLIAEDEEILEQFHLAPTNPNVSASQVAVLTTLREAFEAAHITRLRELNKIVAGSAGPQPSAELLVSPTNLWPTFVRKNYPSLLNSPDSDGQTHEEQERILAHILKDCVEYAARYLWESPLSIHAVDNEANFNKIPIATPTQTKTYEDLFNKIPDEHLSKEFKEQMTLLYEILKHGAEWSKVIATQGSFESYTEYLKKSLFEGPNWTTLQKLPAVGVRIENNLPEPDLEPGFGHAIFFGIDRYNKWNADYVYATDEEFDEQEALFDQKVANGEIKIPTPNDLVKIKKIQEQERIEATWKSLIPKSLLSGEKNPGVNLGVDPLVRKITLGDIRQLMQDASPTELDQGTTELKVGMQDLYDNFAALFKSLVVRRMVAQNVEAPNQRAYGMFPLVEFANANPERTFNSRNEVAIAIGCYMLGFGDYVPNIKPGTLNAGKTEAQPGVWAELTDIQKQQALSAGRPAELFAFESYLCNCNHWFDDDVTMKASLTGNRACITEAYRSQYVNNRANLDGMFRYGVRLITSMFPRPLSYLSAGGDRLEEIFGDPQKYASADFNLIGDVESRFVKALFDCWDYVVTMYKPITTGTRSYIGKNILDLTNINQSKGIFNAGKDLLFDYEAIDKLLNFYSKIVSYWVDRLTATSAEIGDVNNPKYGADKKYWLQLQSPIDPSITTQVHTPLMNMLNLTPMEQHELALSVRIQPSNGHGAVLTPSEELKEKDNFNKWASKAMLKVAMVEDMLRSSKQKADIDDVAALNFVLTTDERFMRWATARYSLRNSSVFRADMADTLNLTPEEIAGMLIDAGLTEPNAVATMLAEAGGLPGA